MNPILSLLPTVLAFALATHAPNARVDTHVWVEQSKQPTPAADGRQKQCPDSDPDLTITACTAVIESSEAKEEARVFALVRRGNAFAVKNDYDRAIRDFDEALRLNPEDAEALYERGNVHRWMKDFYLAIRDYDQAIRINPTAEAYHGRGLANYDQEDYDRAIRDFDEAIRLKIYPEALVARGNAYLDKGDFSRAIQDYDQALQLKPDYAQAFYDRCKATYGKGDLDQAIQDCDQTLKLDPNQPYALLNRGNAYDKKKDYDRAIEDWNKALLLKPDLSSAFHNLGLVYGKMSNYDRAIENFDRAIKLNPRDSEAFYNRGLAYAYKNGYDQAVQNYQEAVRLNPAYASAFNNMGVVLSHKGDYDKAIEAYTSALRLDPGISRLRGRGFAYFLAGRYGAARDDFRRAANLNPADPYTALYGVLSERRDGKDDRAGLRNTVKRIDLKKWPGPALKLFLGDLTPEEYLASARDPDSKKDREQQCEAYFYLGEFLLINGDARAAADLFRKTRESGVETFYEFDGATAELKRLSPVTPAPQ